MPTLAAETTNAAPSPGGGPTPTVVVASESDDVPPPRDDAPPTPPPGASEVQLELWRRVLSHRCRQMRTLSPSRFRAYASGLADDLESSRRRGRNRDDDDAGEEEATTGTEGAVEVDLAAGRFASHLLLRRRRPGPDPPLVVVAEDVARHVLALFYRSIDVRLSHDQRRHGLDSVRGAFARLEDALRDQAVEEDAKAKTRGGGGGGGGGARREGEREVPPLVVDPGGDPPPEEGGRTPTPGGDDNDGARGKRGRGVDPEDDDAADDDEEGGRASKRGRREPNNAPVVHTNAASENPSEDRPEGANRGGGEGPSDGADREDGPEGERHTNAASEQQSNQALHPDPAVETNAAATSSSSNTNDGGAERSSGRPSSREASPPNRTETPSSDESQPSRSHTALHSAALPPPAAHRTPRTVAFLSDIHYQGTASGSLKHRDSCALSYDAGYDPHSGTGSCLADATLISVRERLERWDPFWRVVQELGRRDAPSGGGGGGRPTRCATRTTPCAPVFPQTAAADRPNLPLSCATVTVDLPKEVLRARLSDADASLNESSDADPWGLRWGEDVKTYRTGDRRLLLRTLPLNRSDCDKKKKCDTHLWPKGTFVQLSRGAQERALLLSQRQQQNHDPKLWKGLCKPLDLTQHLPDATSRFGLKICAKEAIEGREGPRHKPGVRVRKSFEGEDGTVRPFAGTVRRYDARFKLYQIAYDDGDAEELTEAEVTRILEKGGGDGNDDDDGVGGGEGTLLRGSYAVHLAVCEYVAPGDLFDRLLPTLPRITLEESREMARRHLEDNIVSLDSDSEGGDAGGSSSSSFLTFSLLCPISKTAIATPVRGRRCKHMQCFDLRNWLESNRTVSGGRWRCGVCDDFVAATDLAVCGLFEAMLRDHRDDVSGARDKVSYRPEDGTWRLKEENRLRYSGKRRGGGEAGKDEAVAEGGDAGQKRGAAEPEVIDLL